MTGIKLENTFKSFNHDGKKITILDNVSKTFDDKKITVIVGESGCGKTTMLRCIAGLESLDSGNIIKNEYKIAMVFQEPRLMPWLPVKKQLTFGLDKTEDYRKIIEIIGLKGFEDFYPDKLSGGMQQRTAIGRALMVNPDYILMDEPFASLDYFTREKMQQEIIRLQKESNTGIIFVTHSIDEALILADKIIILENGLIKNTFEIDIPKLNRDLFNDSFVNIKRNILKNFRKNEEKNEQNY